MCVCVRACVVQVSGRGFSRLVLELEERRAGPCRGHALLRSSGVCTDSIERYRSDNLSSDVIEKMDDRVLGGRSHCNCPEQVHFV